MLHPSTLLPFLVALTVSCLSLGNHGVAQAQSRRAGPERFAVDILTLKSREQFRGAMLGRESDGQIQFAVQRDWLKRSLPKVFESATASELMRDREAAATLHSRITAWINEQPEPGVLRAFLELEAERAQSALTALSAVPPTAKPSQFLLLKFPEARVSSLIVQPAKNRTVAMFAWREQLQDVERKELPELQKELAALDVDTSVPPVLHDRLPLHSQSAEEWAARRGIIEFQFGNRLEYQSFGDSFFESGQGAKQVDWKQILPQLIQQQVKSQFAELLDEPRQQRPKTSREAPLKAITAAAEEKGRRSFRLTQLELDVVAGKVTVKTSFMAQMPNREWRAIWQNSITEDASKERADLEGRIATDPQIKELKETLSLVGLGIDREFTRALRTGAATMAAIQTANSEFQAFQDAFVRHLDGPPLTWEIQRP